MYDSSLLISSDQPIRIRVWPLQQTTAARASATLGESDLPETSHEAEAGTGVAITLPT